MKRLTWALDQALARFRACSPSRDAVGASPFGTIVAVREAELERFAGSSQDDIVAAKRWRYARYGWAWTEDA